MVVFYKEGVDLEWKWKWSGSVFVRFFLGFDLGRKVFR